MKTRRGWTVFELSWLCFFVLLAICISVWGHDSSLGLVAYLAGVICVVLTAKGSIWSFIWGYVNILAYAWLAWTNGLYGEMGLNLFFFLPMTILGLVMWKRNIQSEGRLVMQKLSLVADMCWGTLCAVATIGLGFALSQIEGQNSPYLDALTNVLSVAATFLMIFRYREQWACWFILDIFTVLMWLLRWQSGSPEGPLMVAMWTAYLINAGYGWINWTRQVGKVESDEQ